MYWIDLWKLHRFRWAFVHCDVSNQRVHYSLGLRTKRTNEFSNRTCVFTLPTCVMLILNKKWGAILRQDSHILNHAICVFTNPGVHHGIHFILNSTRHRHCPFKKLGSYVCWFAIEYILRLEILLYRNFHSLIHESTTRASISPAPEFSFLPFPNRGWTRAGQRRVQDNLHAHA